MQPQALPRSLPGVNRVLGISGSLRRGSCNRRLLEAAGECAPARLVVSIWEDLASIPPFDEDLERPTAGGPDVVRRFRERVRSAQGLDKPVAVIGASSGKWGTRLAQAAQQLTRAGRFLPLDRPQRGRPVGRVKAQFRGGPNQG